MFQLAKVLVLIYAVSEWIIKPLNLSGQLSGPAQITAIVCVALAMLGIVIPFLLYKK